MALAEELGVHRRLLYKWRDQLDPVEKGEWPPPENSRESTLRKEVSQLKRVLADKTWKWIFSKVPCKKSRLDASRAATLARRHLRPNPGSDVHARQLEYRADVSTGPGEPGGLLPVVAGAEPVEEEMEVRSTIQQIVVGTSAPLRLSAGHRGTATARNAGQSQTRGAADAGRQLAGRAAAGVRGHHGFRS